MTSPKQLKIIFAGTPEFAACALGALLHSAHPVVAVYTQPDRPAGRGQKVTASPVKQLALQHGVAVYQPLSLRDVGEQEKLKSLEADLMVVAAYGLILPKAVLDIPPLGCINVHASLLPHWRGAAPIQRAILAGDTETGITIMQMDEGLDTGDMLLKLPCSIEKNDTSEALHDRLAKLGAEALMTYLERSTQGVKQNPELATYAHKIKKEEAQLDWSLSAEELERTVRAFNPWPVAFTHCHNQTIRVWQAQAVAVNTQNYRAGEIIQMTHEGVLIACQDSGLLVEKLQFSGGRVITATDLCNSHRQDFKVGDDCI